MKLKHLIQRKRLKEHVKALYPKMDGVWKSLKFYFRKTTKVGIYNNMELREFVSNVISDVTGAIQDCQNGNGTSAVISPLNINQGDFIVTPQCRYTVSHIDFEVCVSAETGNTTDGETRGVITVLSAVIGAKVGTSFTGKDENITKVRFSIPLVYPSVPVGEHKVSP